MQVKQVLCRQGWARHRQGGFLMPINVALFAASHPVNLAQAVAGCHTHVVQLARCLIRALQATRRRSSTHVQAARAVQLQALLTDLLLAAPSSLVALDMLPQLCSALLPRHAASALLHGRWTAAARTALPVLPLMLLQGSEQLGVPAAVAGRLAEVVGAARSMAAAVAPRCD
jgi:dTDP-4-dehydrorhamnose reductase